MPVQPVSSKWLAAISAGGVSHLVVTLSVYSQGAPVPGYQDIAVESVTVSADRASPQRTTMTAQVVPTNGTWFPVPTDLGSPLSPNGNEVVLSAGFRYPDGTTETVQLGIFPIVSVGTDASGANNPDLTITLTADDRSWSISRRALIVPQNVLTVNEITLTANTMDQAILQVLQWNTTGLPPIQYAIVPSQVDAPANTYSQGQDPWQAAMDLATGCGYELFVDPSGNVQGRPLPDPALAPISWVFSDQGVDISILSATRSLNADGVYNDFFVLTNNTDYYTTPGLQAEASDTVTGSPTNINGQFGDIPSVLTSSTSDTLAAAQLEAQLDLAMSLGQVDTIQLEGVLNPAALIDDVCLVTCARIGCSGVKYVVDGFTHTLQLGGTSTYNLRRVIS